MKEMKDRHSRLREKKGKRSVTPGVDLMEKELNLPNRQLIKRKRKKSGLEKKDNPTDETES